MRATAIEYGLILALIGVAAITATVSVPQAPRSTNLAVPQVSSQCG